MGCARPMGKTLRDKEAKMEEQIEEVADNTELLLREIEKRAREVIYKTEYDELYYFASDVEMFYRARFLAYCELYRNEAKEQIFRELKEYGWSIRNVSIGDIDYNIDCINMPLKIYDKGRVLIEIYYPLAHITKGELIRTYEIFQELLQTYSQKEKEAEEFNRRKRKEHYEEWQKKIDTMSVGEVEKLISRISEIFKGEQDE